MDESRGPHQTWVGPQPARTEALPVPPPSHTNYALRPNLASPAERAAQLLRGTFSQTIVKLCPIGGPRIKAEKWSAVGKEKAGHSIDHCLQAPPLHPFHLIGASMEVKPHHPI